MQHYIYGAGGHGKVVLDAMKTEGAECAAFIDDSHITMWAGVAVQPLPAIQLNDAYVHLAIGDNKSRMQVASSLNKVDFFKVKHIKAIVADSAHVGTGSFIAANAILGPDAFVGKHCIINHSAIVDHDCHVADFSHIAPQATLGGGVIIGKGALVGAGAVVLPGVEIGDNVIVGAGAVVTKNVAAKAIVIGIPAKITN